MDRRRVGSAVTALVGVLALALAAATLSSTVERRGGGGQAAGSGSVGGVALPLPSLPVGGPAGSLLALLVVLVLLVALVVAALLLLGPSRDPEKYRDLDIELDFEFRGRGKQWLALLLLLGLVLVVLAALFAGSFSPGFSAGGADSGEPGSQGEAESGPVFVPPVLVVLSLAALVVVIGLVIRFRDRDGAGTASERPDPDNGEDPDPETVARAAGDAADRIEAGGGVENEVYRAWREMTALLSLSAPATRTPGEFADAAVDAGMAPDDVAELTRLFEDVRYGDADPTPETEQRARAVFRRIETTYGDRSS